MLKLAAVSRSPGGSRAQALWLALGGVAYYACASFGMALFSIQPSNITLLWLPSGIGLAMCAQAGRRAWPCVFAASFFANAPGMGAQESLAHLLSTCVAAGADTLAAALAAAMLRRHLPHGLERLSSLFTFIAAVCLLPTLVSAVILAANLALGGYIAWSASLPFVGMLLFADSLGILLVYPLVAAWRAGPAPRPGAWRASLLVTLLALAMAWLAFTVFAGLIFLIVPTLLYLALRGRDQAVYVALALTISAIVALAARDLGPFHVVDTVQARFMLLSYLFSTTVVVLGMALQRHDLELETRARQDWQFLANHDALTGLSNRLSFMPMLENEIERARRNGRAFAVATLDIDHFKRINDTYGHQVGDKVLVAVAGRLRAALRTVDMVARMGGEEFAICFPDTPAGEALLAMERLRTGVGQLRVAAGGQQVTVTISGGMAVWRPDQPCGVDQLLDRADQCLYRAKREGRDRIVTD
ncbi:sensor domain-containing diguanylate cyclase [Duganella sp. FT3S]|uniref:diguanylate cyclase n=1 Tax=Rugamonas fusca TaxID=2758568 RepID=A0A7W2EJA8_9BURK|nr:diguanylate cyclase [Rugamonas fusca]MBA5606928.1 sensor domain-containing diguanylate cyclase [Rugamonas fusca]